MARQRSKRSRVTRLAGWGIAQASRRPGVAAAAVIGVVAVAWLLSGMIQSVLAAAVWIGVAAATVYVVWPEAAMLAGSGDRRPWLVRIREHTWRDVRAPYVGTFNRPAAYAVLAIAWWWLLS
ncbi:MAG: hypothetical protein AAGJ46_18630 [Planctomycetota bacterium]